MWDWDTCKDYDRLLALQTFMELGSEWKFSEELMERLEAVGCQIYTSRTSCVRVNDLRYNLSFAKKREIKSYQLPLSRDCLLQHAQDANYKTAIWRYCLQKKPQGSSPVGNGWKLERKDVSYSADG